jgi:hypothetical protein
MNNPESGPDQVDDEKPSEGGEQDLNDQTESVGDELEAFKQLEKLLENLPDDDSIGVLFGGC